MKSNQVRSSAHDPSPVILLADRFQSEDPKLSRLDALNRAMVEIRNATARASNANQSAGSASPSNTRTSIGRAPADAVVMLADRFQQRDPKLSRLDALNKAVVQMRRVG